MNCISTGTRRLALTVAIAGCFGAPAAVEGATVFSDTFGTSSLNSATPSGPTATSTDYQILATKATSTSAIEPGNLQLKLNATTSSGLMETQALFAATPVTLGAAGDYVQLQATFTATAGILAGGTGSSLNVGLYDSGGAGPVPGGALAASGLSTATESPYDTGNAAGWQGYVGRIVATTGTSQMFTRPIQDGPDTSSESQDALFNNVGGGAFDDPGGTAIGSNSAFDSTLTAGDVYTLTFRLTRDGDGNLVVNHNLYAGAGTGGASLFAQTGTTDVATTLTTEFDALALGFRFAESSGVVPEMDLSLLEVTSNVAVPEPAALSVLALGGLLALRRRH